ncbi:MAG: sigma factor [Bacteroidia bacterium]
MKDLSLIFILVLAVRVDWLMKGKSGDSLSDHSLIEQYHRTGESRWLLAFLSRHRDLIVVRTLNFLRDEDETEDFIGNLFVKLSESLKKQQHIDNPKAWLRRTITNSLIDQSRKKNCRKHLGSLWTKIRLKTPFLRCRSMIWILPGRRSDSFIHSRASM